MLILNMGDLIVATFAIIGVMLSLSIGSSKGADRVDQLMALTILIATVVLVTIHVLWRVQ